MKKANQRVFLSLPFVTLFSDPSPARSLTPFSFPLLNSGKPKLPEIVSACKFLLRNPIFAFCIELKKQLQCFQSVYWERVPKRVRRFRFLRFGFAYGSRGSRFLRFVNYLIFYGSVPRFRFGSRTFLFVSLLEATSDLGLSSDIRRPVAICEDPQAVHNHFDNISIRIGHLAIAQIIDFCTFISWNLHS